VLKLKNKKVIVGLSGGVDSSVAAALLIEQGYTVEGLFMRNWDSEVNNDVKGNQNNQVICPQEVDYLDAKKVATKLGIKLHRVDFIKEYWDYVFSHFVDEYQKGRTPNPDILCNKYIKFDQFLNYAVDKLGADYIAMGHYAGVRENETTHEFELLRGKDVNKDQSYFLCQLSQAQLAKTIFPLYSYTKPEIRALAHKYDLITADKKDSTGICFIGERRFTEFLQNYIANQPGDIVDIKTGQVVGSHIGVMYYTIGQRKGLNLGGMQEPYYVAKKDIDRKILYVSSTSDNSYLMSNECEVNELNFNVALANYFADAEAFTCTAKFRYRQEDIPVVVKKVGQDRILLTYQDSRAVTEGQEAVLYHGEICLGGGTIDSVNWNKRAINHN
jgi:tRNA-specific 2-thiouridylase